MDYLDIADRNWPVLRRAMGVHTWLYRVSGGRIGHNVPGVRGKMLLLDHVGAKSGTKRTSPLLYFPDGDDHHVVAVGEVEQGGGALRAALRPDMVEQQHLAPHAGDVMPDPPAADPVEPGVDPHRAAENRPISICDVQVVHKRFLRARKSSLTRTQGGPGGERTVSA